MADERFVKGFLELLSNNYLALIWRVIDDARLRPALLVLDPGREGAEELWHFFTGGSLEGASRGLVMGVTTHDRLVDFFCPNLSPGSPGAPPAGPQVSVLRDELPTDTIWLCVGLPDGFHFCQAILTRSGITPGSPKHHFLPWGEPEEMRGEDKVVPGDEEEQAHRGDVAEDEQID